MNTAEILLFYTSNFSVHTKLWKIIFEMSNKSCLVIKESEALCVLTNEQSRTFKIDDKYCQKNANISLGYCVSISGEDISV